jgi:hypothetical protein
MNGQRDRNHIRLLSKDSEDATMAVLHKNSGTFRRIDNLEGVQRRG